jgi:hypothetical protein
LRTERASASHQEYEFDAEQPTHCHWGLQR